jgi:hypothetical protein
VRAVGRIAGEDLYLPQFDDVNGQDLQHARRVRWFDLSREYRFEAPVFGAHTAPFGRVIHSEVMKYATDFVQSPPTHWQTTPLPALPPEAPALDPAPDYLAHLVAQVQDLASLYADPISFGEPPAEDELLAHFVVPFLYALGWPPERIALKWRYVDVAVFRALPRTPENLHLLFEAKRPDGGVEGALKQAQSYLAALGVQRDVVVTDGLRYRLHAAGQDFAPAAYANLARLKQSALDLFARLKRP